MDSIPPTERPWPDLAELAGALGDAPLARRALAGFDQDLASTSREPEGRRAYFSAHVALAERRWDEAIRMLREADARTAMDERYALAQLGRASHLAGRADSAIAYYERFLATPDPLPLEDARARAWTYRWLGELYEAAGRNRDAMASYQRFVDLWAEADPELQPRVAEVRGRLDLAGR